MPMIRRTLSPLGLLIVEDVTSFIQQNADAMKTDVDLTSRDGAAPLAHAICYAVSKALAQPPVQVAFTAGVGLTAGTLIYTALTPFVTEP